MGKGPKPRISLADRPLPALALVLAAALLWRLIYLYASRDDIFTRVLVIDAEFYDRWAKAILQGDWLGKEVFYQDPLYAYFLAACYKLFGPSPAAVRVVQTVLDTATVGLLYVSGALLFSPAAGLLAAALAAACGPMVYYTGLLDKTTLTGFLTAVSLASACWASRTLRPGRALLSGLAFGLAALTRGNMLLASVGVGAALLRRKTPGLMRCAALLCGTSLVVGLVALRNYIVGKDFVPLTANAGLNFFIGNNPYTVGQYIEPPSCAAYRSRNTKTQGPRPNRSQAGGLSALRRCPATGSAEAWTSSASTPRVGWRWPPRRSFWRSIASRSQRPTATTISGNIYHYS